MAKKLMIVLLNTDPANPAEVGAPLFQATVAAAMAYEVEVVLTGLATALARMTIADTLRPRDDNPKTVHDLIREAREAGAKFKICTPTLELWGETLIPEIEEIVGGAYIISEAMTEGTVTFTY
jgi:predicted peroxiredoxin